MRRLVMVATAAFLATGALIGFASSSVARPADVVTEDNDDDGVRNVPDPAGDADNKHPSKRDRHAESGRSGNQGKTRAQPDRDGRGPERDVRGLDQPDSPGGDDRLDQDSNNGCGNDDDFEDDSEGRCGGRGADPTPEPTKTPPVRSTATPRPSPRPTPTTVVLGKTFDNPRVRVAGAGQPLATTGFPAQTLALLAIVLIDAGVLALILRPGRAA